MSAGVMGREGERSPSSQGGVDSDEEVAQETRRCLAYSKYSVKGC